MDLCPLADVKSLLGITSNDYDTELGLLISAVSKEAEQFMGRALETGSYTEIFDVFPGQLVFALKAYPVSSITSVKNDPTWDWDNADDMETDDYITNDELGIVTFYTNTLTHGRQALRIVYTGGVASDTSSFKTAMPDVSHAVARQVIYYWNTRKRLGQVASTTLSGQTLEIVAGVEWLPEVRRTLLSHRRPQI